MKDVNVNDFDLDITGNENNDDGIAPASIAGITVSIFTTVLITPSFATNVTESKC